MGALDCMESYACLIDYYKLAEKPSLDVKILSETLLFPKVLLISLTVVLMGLG